MWPFRPKPRPEIENGLVKLLTDHEKRIEHLIKVHDALVADVSELRNKLQLHRMQDFDPLETLVKKQREELAALEESFIHFRQTHFGRKTRNPGGHPTGDLHDPALTKDELRRRLNIGSNRG